MAHKYLLRTRFAKDIVTEFLPLSSPRRRTRVIILCDGMPGVPHAQRFAEWLSKKGFWVFAPRYRGSWESGGVFLRRSPHEDILDVIGGLSKTFTSLYDGAKFKLKPDELFVIGGSFGGAAAILASRDPRVKKAVAISPVVDWRAPSKAEPMDRMVAFHTRRIRQCLPLWPARVHEVCEWKILQPNISSKKIDGSKLFIVHAKDDKVVRYREVAAFAKERGTEFISLKKGGHLSMRVVVEKYWKRIARSFKD